MQLHKQLWLYFTNYTHNLKCFYIFFWGEKKAEPGPGCWDPDEFVSHYVILFKSSQHPFWALILNAKSAQIFFQDQDESDNDYEEPDKNEFEDNYICPASCDIEEDVPSDDDYEPPPTEIPSEVPTHFRVARPLGDGDYLGNS